MLVTENFIKAKKEISDIDSNSMDKFEIRGELKIDEPMARHTSWRVGGKADRYFIPADLDDLCCYLSNVSSNEPIMWFGLGSNLLVRDGGIRGTVIATTGLFNTLEYIEPDRIKVGASVPCAKVARFCAKYQLTGAEFLVGIPGTMGGALAMNAGAFDGETWNIVHEVETLNRKENRKTASRNEFEIAYRCVHMDKDEWFIGAELKLDIEPTHQVDEKLRQILVERSARQPMGYASCGSVFRNPDKDYAARLIEACGLKGKRLGCASVSEKHANFIINNGGATAADIEQLILHVQETVSNKYNIDLIPEVKIIGEF